MYFESKYRLFTKWYAIKNKNIQLIWAIPFGINIYQIKLLCIKLITAGENKITATKLPRELLDHIAAILILNGSI